MVAPLAYPVPPPWGQLVESTLEGAQHPFDEGEQKCLAAPVRQAEQWTARSLAAPRFWKY